jgi:two-component system, chemotaxis family, protein-glutamate methylesterase/glutaminase
MVPAALSPAPPAIDAVVIGGSAGAVSALFEILPGLPRGFPPVLVVVHLPPSTPALLEAVFAARCAMRVREASAFERIESGSVYFAPADYHLLVEPDRRCSLSIGPPVHFSRPAIDVLFDSAADAYGSRLAGVVLTGASEDGASGLAAIREAGGLAIVQEPSTAEVATMPSAALRAVPGALVLPLAAVLGELLSLARKS